MKTRNPGFTLIELLVVIAIISLLVSILLPSLRNAKGLARQTVCLTGLRNMGQAWALYQSDHQTMPAATIPQGNNYRTPGLEVIMEGYADVWCDLFTDPDGGELHCPVALNHRASNGLRRMLWAVNMHLGHVKWAADKSVEYSGKPFSSIYEAGNASSLVLMNEGWNPWDKAKLYRCPHPSHMAMGAYWEGVWQEGNPRRIIGRIHREGSTFLFFDGHSEWIPDLGSPYVYHDPEDNGGRLRWSLN